MDDRSFHRLELSVGVEDERRALLWTIPLSGATMGLFDCSSAMITRCMPLSYRYRWYSYMGSGIFRAPNPSMQEHCEMLNQIVPAGQLSQVVALKDTFSAYSKVRVLLLE